MADEKQTEMASKIEKVLDELRGTEEWKNSKSRQAFHKIMRNFVHGENSTISDEELDRHFLRALTIAPKEFDDHLNWTRSAPQGEKVASSPYYLVNVTHDRKDQFFSTLATDKEHPTGSGDGKKTLNAKFQAKNLYQRFPINATSPMPGKVSNSPLPDWDSIRRVMTDKDKFEQTFDLTNQDQVNSVYGIVSKWDWKSVQGNLFITPELASGDFSPALFAIYFFGRDQSAAKQIFLVITADAEGKPKHSFIGLINGAAEPKKHVFDSENRFAFTYLSNKDNPVKYWMGMPGNDTFTLGIQTFFPSHPTPYIEVISEFTPASTEDVQFFLRTPFLVTIFMLQKGFLMKDLIQAYYPNSGTEQLWRDVGALAGADTWYKTFAIAHGLESLEKIVNFSGLNFGWIQKPNVKP